MTPAKHRLTYVIFSITLLLSAAMMFALQPMVGKMLLPLVGGTPAGWIVAMAFFQAMLLAGYLLAHLFSTLRTRLHGLFYIFALLSGICFLPIHLSAETMQVAHTPGATDVFLLLTFAVAVPFIALSATSSTVQRLFTATGHSAAHDPYFLYAASNLGSFAGLLLYPLLIEPRLALSAQADLLTNGYILLLLCGIFCLFLTGTTPQHIRAAAQQSGKKEVFKRIPVTEYFYWILLAFIPSSLLMGVTVYITTDVISVPMIWVLPLGLYLMTFIVAFARTPVISLERLERWHPYAVFLAILLMYVVKLSWLSTLAGIGVVLAIFMVVAQTCHMKLASRRPLENNSRGLTAFYLMMSIGGALGGLLNSFIIPHVLDTLVEFPLVLLASLLLHPAAKWQSRTGKIVALLLLVALVFANISPAQSAFDATIARYILAGIGAWFLITSFFMKPGWREKPMILLALTFFMLTQFVITDKKELLRLRNFYGTIRVFEQTVADQDNAPYHIRYMQHGTTIHGLQIVDDPLRETVPTAYFTNEGPLGDVFKIYAPKNVAIIGLGVGSMYCHAAPDRHFTFIEIDADIITVAQEQFSYLRACQNAAPAKLIIGDGRLELEKLSEEKFDMLIIDAFSSDSIPTHLLTTEAFKLYQDRLTDDGVIVINISNRYFDLWHPIAATAATLGLDAQYGKDLGAERPAYSRASLWMLLAPAGQMPQSLPSPRWQPVKSENNDKNASQTLKPWTDDYTNLLSTLKF